MLGPLIALDDGEHRFVSLFVERRVEDGLLRPLLVDLRLLVRKINLVPVLNLQEWDIIPAKEAPG